MSAFKTLLCTGLLCATATAQVPATKATTSPISDNPTTNVPEENRLQPPKPNLSQLSELAAKILNDLNSNQIPATSAATCCDAYFPHQEFLILKNLPNAKAYFNELTAHYKSDLSALTKVWPADETPEIKSFTPGYCKWKPAGSEYNHIPYWSCYKSTLALQWPKSSRATQTIKIRTIINWGKNWYVTHLGK